MSDFVDSYDEPTSCNCGPSRTGHKHSKEDRCHCHDRCSTHLRNHDGERVKFSNQAKAEHHVPAIPNHIDVTDEASIADDEESDQYFEASSFHSDTEIRLRRAENITHVPNEQHKTCIHPRCNHYKRSQTAAPRDVRIDPLIVEIPRNSPVRSGTSLHPIDFEAAAARLDDTTKHAVRFFRRFQAEFKIEVRGLCAYANHGTIKLAWKDKILRNEGYNSHPKEGWKGRNQRHRSGGHGDGNDDSGMGWDNGNNNTGGDSNDSTAMGGNQNHDRLTNFGEYQSNLRRSITQLLKCHILQPRLRYGYGNMFTKHRRSDHHDDPDYDNYLEPADIRNVAKHDSAHRLRGRIAECRKDLLPLLDRIRDDYRYMEGTLTELKHLAEVLRTYRDAWGNDAGTTDRGERHVDDEDAE